MESFGNKKRGANYTEQEKEAFLQVVYAYRHIIENKKTDGATLKNKKDTWKKITVEYNSISTTGLRTWEHLRNLYDNLKRRGRKSAAANGTRYEQRLVNIGINQGEVSDLRKKATEDKREIFKTGGQSRSTKLDEPLKPVCSDTDNAPPNAIQPTPISNKTNQLKLKVTKKKVTSEQFKIKYFKAKIANANLQRTFLICEHRLQMQIYREQLKKLQE